MRCILEHFGFKLHSIGPQIIVSLSVLLKDVLCYIIGCNLKFWQLYFGFFITPACLVLIYFLLNKIGQTYARRPRFGDHENVKICFGGPIEATNIIVECGIE